MIRPLHDFILVQQVDPIESGSIIVQDYLARENVVGRVEAVGGDVQQVAVGDIVLLGYCSGVDVVIGQQRFILVREADTLCLLAPTDLSIGGTGG